MPVLLMEQQPAARQETPAVISLMRAELLPFLQAGHNGVPCARGPGLPLRSRRLTGNPRPEAQRKAAPRGGLFSPPRRGATRTR